MCAHAPTEDKDNEKKNAFYELFNRTYKQCCRHDIKYILGDLKLANKLSSRNMVVNTHIVSSKLLMPVGLD